MATAKTTPPKTGMAKVLALAHSPKARAKAAATQILLGKVRQEMAERYGAKPTEFMQRSLLDTLKRLDIPLHDVPVELFKPFPVGVRKQLLAKRGDEGNGHDRSIGIPLDAIPERAPKKTPSKHDPFQHRRGHPNSELISKILDLLANPQIDDRIAERLLTALDKLT